MSLLSPSSVVSGEGVRLALPTAALGSRIIAATIDLVAQYLVLVVVLVGELQAIGQSDVAALAAVALTETVLVFAGYPIVLEWLTRGRTVGKLCLGLRVVRDDGGPIGFRQALVRGLAGFFLEKPGLFFPGVVTLLVSRQDKRIGDMMAGTVVLNERAGSQHLAPVPSWVAPPLQPWVLALDLSGLDDRLALQVRQFVSRAHGLGPAAQQRIGEELRARVLAVVSPAPPWGAPTPAVLAGVLTERSRRASLARSGRPPAPLRPAGPYPTAGPDPAAGPYPAAGPDAPSATPASPAPGGPFSLPS